MDTLEKSLFRLAAIVYGNSVGDIYTNNTLLSMIESVLLNAKNQPLQMSSIISIMLEDYSLIMTEEEFEKITQEYNANFLIETTENGKWYSLTDDRYNELEKKAQNGIDHYINIYIMENELEASAKEVFYRYLYTLTTTNITSYKRLLGLETGNDISSEELISVDPSLFTDTERAMINGFLLWDNSDKNSMITNIVLCCLEYCLVISGDKANELTEKYLIDKYIYLDTNIIFRALGINGSQRKTVTMAFLSKCKQAGIHMLITSYTKREFMNTLRYYVDQAIKLPTGNVYAGAYEELCDYNVFTYYNDWKSNHNSLPNKLFWAYIDTEINNLFDAFSIEENKSNIFSSEAQRRIDQYDAGICRIKENDPSYIKYYYGANKHDAILVYIAEEKRIEIQQQNSKANCLIATTDKQLRFWDYSRSESKVPFIVYPSQLFALLIKLTGRSTNDIKSFISFINIKPVTRQISESKVNAILSAIGSLTDDFRTQKLLVSSIFNDEFQKVIFSSRDESELYEMSKEYGKKVMDEKLKEQETRITAMELEITKIHEKSEQEERSRNEERKEQEKEKLLLDEQVRTQNDLIEQMAYKHTKLHYLLVWFILPILAIVLGLGIVIMLGIGIWGNEEGNLSLRIINWFCKTPIGKNMSDPYGWVIPAAIAAVGSLELYGITRLFSSKRAQKREEYMKNYLHKMKVKNY